MKPKSLKKILLIGALIVMTGAAMAYSSKSFEISPSSRPQDPPRLPATNGILGISGRLIQNKVMQGSEGRVGLNITLQAADNTTIDSAEIQHADMVIVLDRSGSMKGLKIDYARQAILNLLSGLTVEDRFALVTYSDGVHIASDLLNVTTENRRRMETTVQNVRAGGGTNLGAGLQAGINILGSVTRTRNASKVILISDGLANKGITDLRTLSQIAGNAVKEEFAISTVGVGAEFNEYLMTAIADRGAGSYYYLENPAAFAEVFQKEISDTRTSIVNNLKIQLPLSNGINLVDAAGYPISRQNGMAVFYPGSLRPGQNRSLFLTLQVPTNETGNFELSNIKIGYHHTDRFFEKTLAESYQIACVRDRRNVISSIDKAGWSDKVINDDFNRLKQDVAADIKSGKKEAAMKRIRAYSGEKRAINAAVGSASVAENLDRDVRELESYVEKTFQGSPAAVRQKQKTNAKALQYDGYRGRRK